MEIQIVEGKIGNKRVFLTEVALPNVISGQGYDKIDALWELYEQAGDELGHVRTEIIKKMMEVAKNA